MSIQKKDSATIVAALNKRAELALLNGDFITAKEQLDACRSWISKSDQEINPLYADYHATMGDYYMNLSDANIALKHYRKVFAIRTVLDGQRSFNTALSLSRLARYHNFMMNIDSALYYAEKAWGIVEENKMDGRIYPVYQILETYAYAFKVRKRSQEMGFNKATEKARQLFLKALDFAAAYHGHENAFSGNILRNIGNTYTDIVLNNSLNEADREEPYKEGMRYYKTVAQIYHHYFGEVHPELSTLYYVMGLLNEYRNNPQEREQKFSCYDRAIEALGVHIYKGDSLNLAEIKACKNKYDLLSILYQKTGALQRAHYESGNRSYLLRAGALAHPMLYLWDQAIQELESEFSNRLLNIYAINMFEQVNNTYQLLYRMDQKRVYLDMMFLIAEKSRNSLRRKLLYQSGATDQNVFEPVSISTLQQKLEPDMYYLCNISHRCMLAVTKDKAFAFETLQSDSLPIYMKDLKAAMINRDPDLYDKKANALYTCIFSQILDSGAVKPRKLLLSMSDYFNGLPVAGLTMRLSLPGSNFGELNYLLHKYEIGNILSASDYVHSFNVKIVSDHSLLGISPSLSSFAKLPFANTLMKEMAEEYEGTFFTASAAEGAVKEIFNGPQGILHLGTHAFMDKANILKSHLLIGDDSLGTEGLSMDSLFRLKKQYNLVSLIACSTGEGSMEYGEGTINFSKAFLYTGSGVTLSTLWDVDDKTSAILAKAFFKELSDGIKPCLALRRTQLEYLRNCANPELSNPYYWAGLIVTGKNNIVIPARKSQIPVVVYMLVGLLVLAVSIAWYKKSRHTDRVRL
ncbi:MAG: CHAT domain-containing protein [Bacteroidetes bacterium]|nr:CHAT domain-containing protein [Bacteroidota bacterium]